MFGSSGFPAFPKTQCSGHYLRDECDEGVGMTPFCKKWMAGETRVWDITVARLRPPVPSGGSRAFAAILDAAKKPDV